MSDNKKCGDLFFDYAFLYEYDWNDEYNEGFTPTYILLFIDINTDSLKSHNYNLIGHEIISLEYINDIRGIYRAIKNLSRIKKCAVLNEIGYMTKDFSINVE